METESSVIKEAFCQTVTRKKLRTFQVNLGKFCNMRCRHCHVDAGPERSEIMLDSVMDSVIKSLELPGLLELDITGGAPELHPRFLELMHCGIAAGLMVTVRCNLSVLLLPSQSETPAILAANRVKIIASLPCYLEKNVDSQRGEGAFRKSIAALKILNSVGYGRKVPLNLVYNPTGLNLAGNQAKLEEDYKRVLQEEYGIEFHHLFCLHNFPVGRFYEELLGSNRFHEYMQLLLDSYNPKTMEGLMCRDLVSVSWDGFLYDCDFHQMKDLPITFHGSPLRISDLTDLSQASSIQYSSHCLACMAGSGASCGGALV
ncbi:MAG: arsenosugar biosynthesis radical SAM protein ArsS [Candidatus Cloacimonetes bacterium]|nr:arsenosugar biosynthesis radical SAM protein ArsS [Candidatus Cloacimonadota bacterium]